MHWIALQWRPEAEPPSAPPASATAAGDAGLSKEALGWWALQFTPYVAWVDEILLLEVSASLRLWGGRRALLRRIHESNPMSVGVQSAQNAIGIVAMALLRLRLQGQAPPAHRPAALPLHTLTAARAHLPLLARLGCHTWGDLQALPRGPLVRRFGPALRQALDIAWGLAPESYRWLSLPEVFEQSLELPARVDDAPALMWSAKRLLTALQLWLRARQRGVLAFELQWRLDLKRLNGRALPPTQSLVIRTAEPAQAMAHLRRLLAERLAHTRLLAPAVHLQLRSLDTAPWAAETSSFLPEDQRTGEPLHVFVERVGARLGAASVQSPVWRADHRPECMQGWQVGQLGQQVPRAAASAARARPARPDGAALLPDALAPTWLLRQPLPLGVQHDGQPWHHGPLRLLAGPHRVETGWWPDPAAQQEDGTARPDLLVSAQREPVEQPGNPAAARDYYIAQNSAAELLWIYRERATAAQQGARAAPRWFLQGLYA